MRWGDSVWETRTDDEGFVDMWVEPPADVRPGWQEVTLELVSPDDAHPLPTTSAPVLVVDPRAEYGVISDIDDTVIVTGVTSKLKRAYALFLTEHRTRLPFEGVNTGRSPRSSLVSRDAATGTSPFSVSS